MRSKAILYFGYKGFLNYYTKMYIFNTLQFFSKCFPCCRSSKHSSMTARKFKRQNNARYKMSEEFDLIQIVKTLRQARLLIQNQLTDKQRQLVNFFKNYSLETKSIHLDGDKKYSRDELVDGLCVRSLDPQAQAMNDLITKKILMAMPKKLDYIGHDQS